MALFYIYIHISGRCLGGSAFRQQVNSVKYFPKEFETFNLKELLMTARHTLVNDKLPKAGSGFWTTGKVAKMTRERYQTIASSHYRYSYSWHDSLTIKTDKFAQGM